MIGVTKDADARGTRRRPRSQASRAGGAIGWLALNDMLRASDADAAGVFLATAHPAKFREVVEPAIGREVPLPPVLALTSLPRTRVRPGTARRGSGSATACSTWTSGFWNTICTAWT